MTRTPNGTLALAATIATLDEGELRALLRRRQIASPRSVSDPLSFAIELLRPESIRAALRDLDRETLQSLLRLSEGSVPASTDGERHRALAVLRGAGLLGIDAGAENTPVRMLPEVAVALSEFAGRGFEETASEDHARAHAAPRPAADTSTWFGPALASVNRGAAVLRALARRPIRLSRKSALTVAAQRELAGVAHDGRDQVRRLVEVMRLAGLAATSDAAVAQHHLVPTAAADEWLARPASARWIWVAAAHFGAMSPPLRHAIEVAAARSFAVSADVAAAGAPETERPALDLRNVVERVLRHEFPLISDERTEDAREWAARAELLGLTVDGWLTEPARGMLRGNLDAAEVIAGRDFPPVAAGVYLQPDLSVIVPGPLDPRDEQALAAIATTEQLGAATALRLSQATLTHALHDGVELDEIRALLKRISLTGIPQPLDYLLGDLARKQRDGRLGEARQEWRRRSPSAPVTESIGAIGLSVGTVPALNTELEELAARVLEAEHSSESAGDLTRRLELAIRHRSTVRVTVTSGTGPDRDGAEYTFTVLPVSLAGGRLRATDQSAGVERTLPVSAIVAVQSV